MRPAGLITADRWAEFVNWISSDWGRLALVHTWALVSAGIAPVALIGGWTLAAARQPTGYSSVRDTISALAAGDATDRWIMTAALAIVGICYLVTAIGLTEATLLGRSLFALGGVATIVVAALPQPAVGHVPAATVAFVALAGWPAVSGVPSRGLSVGATAILVVLLGWFGLQLSGGWLGLTERFLAGAESLWPLIVVLMMVYRNGHHPGVRNR